MKKGFALIAVTIITALLLGIGVFFVSISTTDLRIARAHAATTRAYYLADTAASLMIYEIQHTPSFINRFQNGTLKENNSTLYFSNLFEQNDSANAYAENSERGEATIFVSSSTPADNAFAVRKINREISRALGGAITDYSMLGSRKGHEDIEVTIDVAVNGGVILSNDDIKIKNGATLTVTNGELKAVDSIEVAPGASLVLIDSDQEENSEPIDLPAIDFDSADPTSWKSRATEIMTPAQFNALPDGTILDGIIFVRGTPKDFTQTLTVNGVLVINGNFEIETPGFLRINAVAGAPSGLLVHDKLEIEADVSIAGLVYAGNHLEIEYDTDDSAGVLTVDIDGAIMGRKLILRNENNGLADITITHNPDLIELILQEELSGQSPAINVGHWEEQY